jgi:uncharacterized membrane protein YdfJ with MMPL/SSD domain
VLVLEGEQPLGDDAHKYYDDLIRQLKDDSKHVQHVQDFWGIHSRRAVHKAPMVRPRMFSGTDRALADQMVTVQPVLGHLGARFELGD